MGYTKLMLDQETLDEFLDFVFEVLATATELLMDRLVLVCSRVIASHCNPFNAAALATEASFYQATTLKLSIFDYISSCMETMLESGLLDDMEEDVMRDLASDISRKQMDKAVVSRSNVLADELMVKHREWIALQDIPAPRVRAPQKWKPRSPMLVPKDDGRKSPGSPLTTPDLKPVQQHDEIFSMDEDSPRPPSSQDVTPLHLGAPVSVGAKPVWKSKKVEVEKADFRSIMAAEASRRIPGSPTPTRRPGGSPAAAGSPILGPIQRSTTPSGLSLSSSPGSNGAWRPIEQRKSSLSAVQAVQASPPNPMLTRAPGSLASPAPAGRVINPAKNASTTPRRTSGAAAWATPTTYAAPRPPPPTSPLNGDNGVTQSFSLLSIQQEEQAAAGRLPRKVVKSFAEIQAEEKEAKAEQAQAASFERWWCEEERKRSDAANTNGAGPSKPKGDDTNKGRGRGRGERRVPHRGRGRGKGDANGEGPPSTRGESHGAPSSARGGGRARGRGKPKNKGTDGPAG